MMPLVSSPEADSLRFSAFLSFQAFARNQTEIHISRQIDTLRFEKGKVMFLNVDRITRARLESHFHKFPLDLLKVTE